MESKLTRNISTIILLFFLIQSLQAQFFYRPVFSQLEGQELLDTLKKYYYPPQLFDYGVARDTMFRYVDSKNNKLKCIYTGYTIDLDPSADPTQDAFSKKINTEHIYPESKGASGIQRGDMHNLRPCLEIVNTQRGNLPFGEVTDNSTIAWYLHDMSTTIIPPPLIIDAYSELGSNYFEPREIVKGDIARAIFYFYTLYKEQSDGADPNYFNAQLGDLCNWHISDPVDEDEWMRNQKVLLRQGNENPFVLDCSLAYRTYCVFLDAKCEKLVDSDDQFTTIPRVIFFPNPISSGTYLSMRHLGINQEASIDLFTMDGIRLHHYDIMLEDQDDNIFMLPDLLLPGIYYITIRGIGGRKYGFQKIVVY